MDNIPYSPLETGQQHQHIFSDTTPEVHFAAATDITAEAPDRPDVADREPDLETGAELGITASEEDDSPDELAAGLPVPNPSQADTPAEEEPAPASPSVADSVDNNPPPEAPGKTGLPYPEEEPEGKKPPTEAQVHVMEELGGLMGRLDTAQKGALGALFADFVDGVPLADTPPTPEEADEEVSLAAFDVPKTEGNKLRFDRQLDAWQYTPTLEAAGLRFVSDPYREQQLCIADGSKFAELLAAIPHENEALARGMRDVVAAGIIDITLAHVPNVMDRENFETFHLHPKLEVAELGDNASPYNGAAAETLVHATAIADELQQRFGADDKTVVGLRNARTAEVEDMLPEWAVANYWGTYRPPTTNSLDSEWTQWLTREEWGKMYDFMDNAAAKAPAGSAFIYHLASTMVDSIARLRNNDLAPTEWQPAPHDYTNDDDDLLDFHFHETPETIALNAAFARQYDQTLAEAQERLRRFLQL